MKKYMFLLLCFLQFGYVIAQIDALPYNPNLAFLAGVKGVKTIKVIQSDNATDYQLEVYHFFDKKNRNIRTVYYYKDSLQGIYYFKFDKKGRVIREDNYSSWVNGKLDTSKVFWIIDYKYFSNGLLKSVDTWFDVGNSNYKTITFYKYNRKSKLIREERIAYPIGSTTPEMYSEANSNKSDEKQNLQKLDKHVKKYKYTKGLTIIVNYRNDELRSKIVEVASKNLITSHLINVNGDTLRTVKTYKNNKSNIIKVQITGDKNISDFCEYSDEVTNDLTTYGYNKAGLIESIIYDESKWNFKRYVKFEYISR